MNKEAEEAVAKVGCALSGALASCMVLAGFWLGVIAAADGVILPPFVLAVLLTTNLAFLAKAVAKGHSALVLICWCLPLVVLVQRLYEAYLATNPLP